MFSEDERIRLVENIARHMTGIDPDIQRRQIAHFTKADPEYGARIARKLNLASISSTDYR